MSEQNPPNQNETPSGTPELVPSGFPNNFPPIPPPIGHIAPGQYMVPFTPSLMPPHHQVNWHPQGPGANQPPPPPNYYPGSMPPKLGPLPHHKVRHDTGQFAPPPIMYPPDASAAGYPQYTPSVAMGVMGDSRPNDRSLINMGPNILIPMYLPTMFEKASHLGINQSVPPNGLRLRSIWSSWLQLSESVLGSNDALGHSSYGEQMILERGDRITALDEVIRFMIGIGNPSTWLEATPLALNPKTNHQGSIGEQIPVDGICFFLNGVKPQWEDEKNRAGGHYEIKYMKNQTSDKAYLDHIWQVTLLAVTAAAPLVDPSRIVTGLRLLKKSPKGKTAGMHLRLEVWITTCDEEKKAGLRHSLNNFIENSYLYGRPPGVQSNPFLNAEWKSHHEANRSMKGRPNQMNRGNSNAPRMGGGGHKKVNQQR